MKSCRLLFLLLLLLAGSTRAWSQRDSLPARDSVFRADTSLSAAADTLRKRDTFAIPPLVVVPQRFDSLIYAGHPFLHFRGSVRLREAVHRAVGKEAFFYSIALLLLLFAIARNAFARYLQDLFRIFFRANVQQRQAKEQLQQTPVPSLFMNFLFVLSAALFLVLLFHRFGLGTGFTYWQLLGYTAAALAALYTGKFLVLRLVGWIFRVPGPAEAYLFIIFTANKIIGIVLLPFIILLAFTSGGLNAVALTLSVILLGALYAYRYFLSWITVQRQVRLGLVHFIIYFLAFEVTPLLLINKLLFRFLG
jgi:hypothetical protein